MMTTSSGSVRDIPSFSARTEGQNNSAHSNNQLLAFTYKTVKNMKCLTKNQRWQKAEDEIIKKKNPAVAAQQEAGSHFIVILMNSGRHLNSALFLSVCVSWSRTGAIFPCWALSSSTPRPQSGSACAAFRTKASLLYKEHTTGTSEINVDRHLLTLNQESHTSNLRRGYKICLTPITCGTGVVL